MLTVLDALVTWREAAITGLSCSHALSDHVVTNALPSSRLTAKADGTFVVPVAVPLEITETVKVEATGEEEHAALAAVVASLKALDPARPQSRIHSHVLVSETVGVDENKRRQAVLVWKVVASWR